LPAAQIERPPTELRRIPLPSHNDLLSRPPESRNRTLRNRGYSTFTAGSNVRVGSTNAAILFDHINFDNLGKGCGTVG
jgi:hypothetical protein